MLTELEAQALAWRLHDHLPLGWHIETVGVDLRPSLGYFVELRNNQRPFQVRVFTEEDVAHFYQLHGPQWPIEFDTDSFILHFHPEQVRIELAEEGHVALSDVIELITWGQQYLPFLHTLAAKRVRCPTCGRTDCKLLRVERATGLHIWQCWDEHWFTSTYDFENYVVLSGEPAPESDNDIPF